MPCSWAATSRGGWPVAGHLRIQESDRCAVLKNEPNGCANPKRVQIWQMRSSPGKPVTNRNSRGPGIVMHFGLCPAVTRRAHSRHERFDGGRSPRMAYSMARILSPQTSDTFPSFRATSGTGYRMQSNRRSVAVQSHSAWWVCSDQCGVPARCRPAFSGVSMGPVAARPGPRSRQSQDAAASMIWSSPSLTALITAM